MAGTGGPGALGLLFLAAMPLILTIVVAHTRTRHKHAFRC
jgi:hypothetical protein